MARLIVIYWRDIPSQVLVRSGRVNKKILLPPRFQEAIDRAAMRAGRSSSEHYLADWRRAEPVAVSGDPGQVAVARAEEFDKQYDDARLLVLIRNHGVDNDVTDVGVPESGHG